MPPISSRPKLLTENRDCQLTHQASSKIKPPQECAFFNFQQSLQLIPIFLSLFTKKAHPCLPVPIEQHKPKTNHPSPITHYPLPITHYQKKKHFYQKKDKKEAKGLFRVFKKASSSLRFRIKSPFRLQRIVFDPENLLFWNPPQGNTAFFFFLFSFAKMCMRWSEVDFQIIN